MIFRSQSYCGMRGIVWNIREVTVFKTYVFGVHEKTKSVFSNIILQILHLYELYTNFTRSLHDVYTKFTRNLHNVYTKFTHNLNEIYTGQRRAYCKFCVVKFRDTNDRYRRYPLYAYRWRDSSVWNVSKLFLHFHLFSCNTKNRYMPTRARTANWSQRYHYLDQTCALFTFNLLTIS